MERSSVTNFDRLIGSLDGRPGVTKTKPATVRALSPIIGAAETFIVQTYRIADTDGETGEPAGRSRDTVFIEYMGAELSLRFVIPPEAAAVIARQRQALTDKSRSRAAKRVAGERKARGEVPGFMRKKK